MNHNTLKNRLTAVFLSTCLIVGNIGVYPLAAYAAEEDTAVEASSEGAASEDRDIDSEVAALLSAGEYEEGSVIVLYDKASPASDGEQLVGASELLANAEEITDVSAESYVEATGDTLELPEEELVGGAADVVNDDRIGMVLVEDESKTTEELIRELLADPRVLTAEPNYILSISDVDDDTMEAAAEVALDGSTLTEGLYEAKDTAGDISEAADKASAETDENPEVTAEAPEVSSENPEVTAEAPEVSSENPEEAAEPSEELIESGEANETALAAADESAEMAAAADDVLLPETEDTAIAETAVGAANDLTPYQWGMSDGTNRYAYYNVEAENVYGMCIPNWNISGAVNAEGVVAVIDSGVDYTHPELADNMYRFSAKAQKALGCGEYGISSVPGVRDAKDPSDVDGHGTHCAGIIAASWDGVGVSGVTSGAKIMAVRALDDQGFSSYSKILNALSFVKKAKEYGIDVRATSNSYSCSFLNYAIRVLVDELGGMGVVNVFASGNEDQHVDAMSTLNDGLWDLPNVIIVNASDAAGNASSFTNFGQNSTHVFAPGVDILSTVPDTDSKEAQRAYLPQLDPNPVYYDPAWNNLSDKLFDSFNFQWMTAEYSDYFSYSKVYDQSSCGITPALKIQINKDIPADTGFPICLSLPVADGAKVTTGSLGFYIPEYDENGNRNNKIYAQLGFFGENSQGVKTQMEAGASYANIDWVTVSVSGLEELDLIETVDGKSYVSLYAWILPKAGGQIKAGDYIYIDNPALGSASYNTDSTLYTFLSGTSMATPAVAGAAMVLYNGKSVNRESGNQVTADVKASVRKKNSLTTLCTSGGVVDLSITNDQMVPVINTAVLNDAEGTITLEGYYFGTLGSECEVTLAGSPLTIKSWNNNSITVESPKSMASGLQKITVTNASGITTIGAFSITVPESSTIKDTATPLYEKTLPDIPAELIGEGETMYASAGLDDYIYVALANDNFANTKIVEMIRYSINDDSWEKVGEVPYDGLGYSSMAAYRGCIFISGRDSDGDDHLVRYVPSSGKWFETPNCGASGAALVNYKDSLLYAGGYNLDYSNSIQLIDVYENTLTKVGSLSNYLGLSDVTYLDNTLYIYTAEAYNGDKNKFENCPANLTCYTYNGKAFVEDTSKEVDPSAYRAQDYDSLIGSICSSDKDVYLVGSYMKGDGSEEQRDPDGYSVADGETWILGNTPENLNKRLSHTITYNTVATVYKGVLYGFGLNSLDGNPTSHVLRATQVDENPSTPLQDTVTVEIPKAVSGLVYNGKEQIGVPASTDGSYVVLNNKKTEPGTYEATVKLTDPEYYVWEDGTREDKIITWAIAEDVVHVKSVKLNTTNLTLYTGQTAQLKATVSPSDADNKNVTWKSAKTSVATVNSKGKVTAKAAGTVKVTVTTADGKKTAVCTVKVIKSVPVYRLYNKNGNGEHLYTANASEKNALVLRGWKYEGIAWRAPAKSSVPVYRFYNKNNGLHMYSSNAVEKKALVKAGWKLEGIAFYAATTGTTKPIYRLYNPNGGDHFFTASASERNTVRKAGWKYEGAAFQMVK